MTTCPRCHGDGLVRWLAAPPDPQTEEDATCPKCGGDGCVQERPA